jgi:hypothetical protein
MPEIAVTFNAAKGELRREIAIREGFYRERIRAGKMKKAEAELHQAYLRGILEIIDQLEERRNELPADYFRLRTITVDL